ncbi:LamG domain-containing protein [bacterium]|nr:LamG domain-containing protein [bacterium]
MRKFKIQSLRESPFFIPILLTALFLILIVCRLLLSIFGEETNFSIFEVEGTILGVQSGTTEWSFADSSKYTLSDDTYAEIVGGVVKLIPFDQEDSDNTQEGFGDGTHSNTQWDSSSEWVELTTAGQISGSGDFTSRVLDAKGSTSWDTISWAPQRPTYKELPGNAQTETGYNSGNANMSGNVLLMHMNEASGTIVDSSGQGNSGTYNGTLYSQSGKLNNAIGFDGSNDIINCGNADSLHIGGNITVSMWLKLDGLGSYQGMYGGSNSIGNRRGTTLGKWTDQRWTYFVGRNTTAYWAIHSNDPAVTGRWYHVVGVVDSGTMYMYVDGVQQTQTQSGVTLYPVEIETIIGRWYSDSAAHFFHGDIDEVAVWNRGLSSTEILDIYKRGALRLKIQVRSGDTNPLTGNFVGPNGTTGDFYDELSNSTLGTPSLSLTNVTDNQYFQYKTYFETDNSSYTPELKSIEVGPDHYSTDSPTVSNNTGTTYTQLTSFTEVLGAGNEGVVRYQISNNNGDWYYWGGTEWIKETGQGAPSEASTASVISANMSTFHSSVGTGEFFFRGFLTSDNTQQVEINSVELWYTTGTEDPPPEDDDDDGNTYVPSGTQSNNDDEEEEDENEEDTTPEAEEEDVFDIYIAEIDIEDRDMVQLKGLALKKVWIIAKLDGDTIASVYANSEAWEMSFSISRIRKYLESGENVIEIQAYDEERNLLESKEVTLLGEVEYKIDNYQGVRKVLDSTIVLAGIIDLTSGGSLLIKKYKEATGSLLKRVGKIRK